MGCASKEMLRSTTTVAATSAFLAPANLRNCRDTQTIPGTTSSVSRRRRRPISPAAEVVARSVWDICKKKGDIYLDRYEGWCPAVLGFRCEGHFLSPSCLMTVHCLQLPHMLPRHCSTPNLSGPVGRYMVREERFITDQEAQEFNFKAGPSSGGVGRLAAG